MNNLNLFDLTKLVGFLNEQVESSRFSLIPKIFEKSKRNPFINKIDGSERQTVGKYHVMNNGEKAGYLIFEQGIVSDDDINISYEQIKLCLYPVQLKNGQMLPKSTVKLYAEDMYSVMIDRIDHSGPGLFWKWRQTDLSSVLPTDYFLRDEVSRRRTK